MLGEREIRRRSLNTSLQLKAGRRVELHAIELIELFLSEDVQEIQIINTENNTDHTPSGLNKRFTFVSRTREILNRFMNSSQPHEVRFKLKDYEILASPVSNPFDVKLDFGGYPVPRSKLNRPNLSNTYSLSCLEAEREFVIKSLESLDDDL